MVVMQLPDGSTAEFLLDDTDHELRVVSGSRCVSYDLVTVLTEAGWRIRDITTDLECERLRRLLTPARRRAG
jgi:hypothetical protein